MTDKMSATLRGLVAVFWLLICFALPVRADSLGDVWRGITAYQAGKYETALRYFDTAFESRSLSYQHRQIVSFNRALTHFRLGDHAQAIEDFNRVLQLNARHHRGFAGRGAAFAAIGEFYRALQDYNRALKFNPDFALAYLYRAHVYERLGDQATAIEDLERALSIDPNLEAAREGLKQLGALTQQ